MSAAVTPSQTIGPFFSGILDERLQTLTGVSTPGERLRLEGTVSDGEGRPVADAMSEIWQADAYGRYGQGGFGFGRAGTDEGGAFWFETVRPGRVPHPTGGLQAQHFSVTLFARGLLNHVCSRLYLEDDRDLETDPVLRQIPPERRATLLARRVAGEGRAVYRAAILLQGGPRSETVFFAL